MDSKHSKFLDELAKLVADGFGLAQGAKGEMENIVKTQGEKLLAEFDLVDRDSFESLKQTVQELKIEVDKLRKKIDKKNKK